jgi:hypothetical protein
MGVLTTSIICNWYSRHRGVCKVYGITKIKLLPNSTADAKSAHSRPLSIESNSIDASKLLQNVEKSYDKEVKDEEKKLPQRFLRERVLERR